MGFNRDCMAKLKDLPEDKKQKAIENRNAIFANIKSKFIVDDSLLNDYARDIERQYGLIYWLRHTRYTMKVVKNIQIYASIHNRGMIKAKKDFGRTGNGVRDSKWDGNCDMI